MHKVLLNALRLRLQLEPRSGFLIKASTRGENLLHPERPDLQAMRTRLADGNETVFIPGSSLKGVVRASAERVLRSLAPEHGERLACDPLHHAGDCQKAASRLGDDIAGRRTGADEAHPMAAVHRMLCLACRTFGSQALASRVRLEDAIPPDADALGLANRTEVRAGVSIDRRTGGPARGKLFESEVVTGGTFQTQIHLDNVQLWQVALLGFVLEDLDAGLIRLGSAKTRGLGAFRVHLGELHWRQVGQSEVPLGAGALAPGLVAAYDLVTPDALDALPGEPDTRKSRLTTEWTWKGPNAIRALFEAVQGQPWDALVAARAPLPGQGGQR